MKALTIDEAQKLIDATGEAHVMVNYRQRLYFYIDGYPLPGASYLEDWEYVLHSNTKHHEVAERYAHFGVLNDQVSLDVFTMILNGNVNH